MPKINRQQIEDNLVLLSLNPYPHAQSKEGSELAYDLVQMRLTEAVECDMFMIPEGTIVWVDRNSVTTLAADPHVDVSTNRLMYPRSRVSLKILEEYDEFSYPHPDGKDGECCIVSLPD